VCILDSGVDASHPLVGGLDSAVAISLGENEETIADEDTEGDVSFTASEEQRPFSERRQKSVLT
jgi:hypothetical protein